MFCLTYDNKIFTLNVFRETKRGERNMKTIMSELFKKFTCSKESFKFHLSVLQYGKEPYQKTKSEL